MENRITQMKSLLNKDFARQHCKTIPTAAAPPKNIAFFPCDSPLFSPIIYYNKSEDCDVIDLKNLVEKINELGIEFVGVCEIDKSFGIV